MADLKLKDLRYLVAVADTRHFGRAAERSFVSQPTLSAQLKKLEEYLGVQLIERAPKRVALTAAGEEIVERARRIVEASEEIVELAKGHRDPLAGRLRLALLPTIGPYLLPNVAAKLRKQLPRLELMLYEYQTDVMLEKLHSGEIDVGILALPVSARRPRSPASCTTSRSWSRCPRTIASRASASIKLDDLNDETLLLLEDGHCLRDQALDICSGTGMHEKQDFRATSLETLRQMVAAGVGITLLPELAGRGAYGNAARRGHQALREARAHAHHRRGVAQIERAARSHPRAREAHRGERAVSALPADVAKVTPESFNIRCPDGRELAANWFAASEAGAPARRGGLLISSATGFPQTFYFKLAEYAAARGYDALVYDYRGMGWSAPPDLSNETTRMSDWGLIDMRAALEAVAERARGVPLATLGHSVGGQFLGLLSQPLAGARARAGGDVRRVLALGTRAVQVSRVVVLARARAAHARAEGLRAHRRWLGGPAAAARRVRGVAALVPAHRPLRP